MKLLKMCVASGVLLLFSTGCMDQGSTSGESEKVSVVLMGNISENSSSSMGAPAISQAPSRASVSVGNLSAEADESGNYVIRGKLPCRGLYLLKALVDGVEITRQINICDGDHHFFHRFALNKSSEVMITESVLDIQAKQLQTIIESMNLTSGSATVILNETQDGLVIEADDAVKTEISEQISARLLDAETAGRKRFYADLKEKLQLTAEQETVYDQLSEEAIRKLSELMQSAATDDSLRQQMKESMNEIENSFLDQLADILDENQQDMLSEFLDHHPVMPPPPGRRHH